MPDWAVLYPGRFLEKRTLEAPKTIRIVDVVTTQLETDKGIETKVVIKYKDTAGEGEIVWNKTNAALTSMALNERDYTKWKGRLITIMYDPTVKFGAEQLGGIRVCGSPELKRTMTVKLKRPRRKNPEIYRLLPTNMKGETVQTGEPEDPPVDGGEGGA